MRLQTGFLFIALVFIGLSGAQQPVQAQDLPSITAYSLGQAEIVDPALADLRIPVELEGVLVLPETVDPAPLAIVLHGRHAMCGVDISTYPCAPGEEIRYDRGFLYLLIGLARRGYAALAINLNAAMTEAYGRGDINTRAEQIVAQHLAALRAAGSGSTVFPDDVAERIDFARMALIGHSSGGGAALQIARHQREAGETEDIDALLLIAAAYNALGPEGVARTGAELYAAYSVPSDLPVATILPDCDGDQIDFWSQIAYEAARLDPERTAFAASVRVFMANHNHFNAAVSRGDRRFGYPPCFGETSDIMPRAEQEAFLVGYANAFLEAALGDPTGTIFDPLQPPPTELFGQPVQINLSPPAAQRRALLTDAAITASSRAGVMTCAPGDVCLGGITTAGRFGFLHFSYGGRGGLTFALPAAPVDLTAFSALNLRLVPDYTSALNTPGTPLALTVALIDADGAEAEVSLPASAALDVPPPAEYYGYEPFVLYPALIHVPLEDFTGIDRTRVSAVSLRTDGAPGAVLVADVDLIAGR